MVSPLAGASPSEITAEDSLVFLGSTGSAPFFTLSLSVLPALPLPSAATLAAASVLSVVRSEWADCALTGFCSVFPDCSALAGCSAFFV